MDKQGNINETVFLFQNEIMMEKIEKNYVFAKKFQFPNLDWSSKHITSLRQNDS